MNENFDAFDEYAMKYDMNIKEIAYKYNHSYRVCQEHFSPTKTSALKKLTNLVNSSHLQYGKISLIIKQTQYSSS